MYKGSEIRILIYRGNNMLKMLKNFPYLSPFEEDLELRMKLYKDKRKQLVKRGKKLFDFANAHKYYGFHRVNYSYFNRKK